MIVHVCYLAKVFRRIVVVRLSSFPIGIVSRFSTRHPDPPSFMSNIAEADPEEVLTGRVSLIEEQLNGLLFMFVHDFGQETASIFTIL